MDYSLKLSTVGSAQTVDEPFKAKPPAVQTGEGLHIKQMSSYLLSFLVLMPSSA